MPQPADVPAGSAPNAMIGQDINQRCHGRWYQYAFGFDGLLQFHQAAHSFLRRRVGAQPRRLRQATAGQEHAFQPADPQPLDLHQRPRQTLRIPGEARGVEIRIVFAGALQPQLRQRIEAGRKNQDQDGKPVLTRYPCMFNPPRQVFQFT